MEEKLTRQTGMQKCAVFYGRHDIRMEERRIPEIKEDEILVRVMACGICGTDVHIFEGDKGAADTTPPVILGHEFSGIVDKIGSAVRDLMPGDRVCVDPNVLCGACRYCLEGNGHFCEHMIGIGTTIDGGFAQYCAVPAKQAYLLADGVSFDQGAMTEPLACCLHGIDMCEIRPGSTAAVIGGGMIGLLMVQLCRQKGAANVILVEPVAKKRELGRRLGADLLIDPFAEDTEAVLKEHGIGRIEVVIECAGLPTTIEQAIRIAGKKSTVMMFGLTRPDDMITVKPFEIFQKEITLKASFINPYTQGRAIGLLNSGRIDVDSMVYGTAGLAGLSGILSDPAARARGKYIIHPWDKEG